MRLSAGELTLILPTGWNDQSDYAYSSPDETLSLHVSRLHVRATITPSQLLTERKSRLEALGSVKEVSRATLRIDDAVAESVTVDVDPPPRGGPGTDNHLDVRLLVIKVAKDRAVVATLTGPRSQRPEIDGVWQQILDGFHLNHE